MGNEDLRLQLEYLQDKRRRKNIVNFRGLHMTEREALEIKAQYCGGCGNDKGKYPKMWFGELFCSDCVERFQSGK